MVPTWLVIYNQPCFIFKLVYIYFQLRGLPLGEITCKLACACPFMVFTFGMRIQGLSNSHDVCYGVTYISRLTWRWSNTIIHIGGNIKVISLSCFCMVLMMNFFTMSPSQNWTNRVGTLGLALGGGLSVGWLVRAHSKSSPLTWGSSLQGTQVLIQSVHLWREALVYNFPLIHVMYV
jgi:hypothetical protein